MKRHVNIPIFIPHMGCPNHCVFCNQKTISGVEGFNPKKLRDIIEDSLATVGPEADVEIAFFGGSFTGIDYDLMVNLLDTAYSYITSGRVNSIRCSTRPDYINNKILSTLQKYGVKEIELGLQSVCDDVLHDTKRGHSFEDECYACKLIIEYGFNLTGQMMVGLPSSTLEKELKTAEFIISAGCKSARIYPTVVFKNTELCTMAEKGIYTPITTEDAIYRSAKVLEKFLNAGVDVIRIGLCASENLSSHDTYYAGPNHPALGELVENQLYYNCIYNASSSLSLTKDSVLRVAVSCGSLSKAIGQKKRNKLLLTQNLRVKDVRFEECASLSGYEIMLKVENGEKRCI